MKAKQITLQNYKSGRTITANSITEFCKIVRLNQIDKYHFTAVLNGERFHHKGWHLPDNNQYIICDINENEYVINDILLFCKIHNLNIGKINKLTKGEIPSYNGLYMLGAEPPIFKRNKKYRFEFKNGNQKIKTDSVSDAADMIGISKSSLYTVSRGLRSQTRSGWKLAKVIEKPSKSKLI